MKTREIELINLAAEMNCTIYEAALEELEQYYEAAGFDDVYEKELVHFSNEQILEHYYSMYKF